MDGYIREKPLYFFVLRTGSRPALDLHDADNDKLLRQLIADNSSRIFRTDRTSCDAKSEQPVAAISGSSLPFGCWDNPKVAATVSRDLHILAINNEIPWGTYKWMDIHGYGMNMPDGGLDRATGFCYEPIAFVDRVFNTRIPEPGKEIAVISEKWGEYGTDILYISLGGDKPKQEVCENNNLEAIESQLEAQITQVETENTESSTPTPDAKTVQNSRSSGKENRRAPKAASEERIKPATAPAERQTPKLRAHRPQLELEPEDGLEDFDKEVGPDYGKPEPYKFGQRLSLHLPWKKEKKRETYSGPPSRSSSVSSTEGRGESWTKTGSLPAIFRKRGKRPQETVASDPVNQPRTTATNGSVSEQKGKKLSRMRRFRNSISDIFRSKRKTDSKP